MKNALDMGAVRRHYAKNISMKHLWDKKMSMQNKIPESEKITYSS